MPAELTPQDQAFLQRAVELGRRGWGRVHPNPTVGCVVVRDDEVVGEGWHQEVGGPHAEIEALKASGDRARGATVYVSLEPCDHFGRTPPCSTALMEAGVRKVVYGARDPGKESRGGAATLREAGIEVLGPGVTVEEARRENPAFFFNAEKEATYVALKLAQTLDGRISEAPGRRTNITGAEARKETHRLRAGFDGVMVGSGTVEADDPLLTVREEVPFRVPPARIILDTRARMSPRARLFKGLPEAPLLIFTGQNAPKGKVTALRDAGATVIGVPEGPGGVSLKSVLNHCWQRGIRSVFCEGGGRLGSQLLQDGWARRLYLFVAPFVLGDQGVPAFPGLASRDGWEVWMPASDPILLGRDVLLTFDRTV